MGTETWIWERGGEGKRREDDDIDDVGGGDAQTALQELTHPECVQGLVACSRTSSLTHPKSVAVIARAPLLPWSLTSFWCSSEGFLRYGTGSQGQRCGAGADGPRCRASAVQAGRTEGRREEEEGREEQRRGPGEFGQSWSPTGVLIVLRERVRVRSYEGVWWEWMGDGSLGDARRLPQVSARG